MAVDRRAEPPARRRTHQVDVRPNRRAQDPHHSEPSGWRRHCRNTRELRAEAPRGGTRDMLLMPTFEATIDTIRNITRELRSIATQYTTNDEASQLHQAPHDSRGHPMLLPRTPGRAPRVVGRGTSSIFKRPEPWLATTPATTSKWAAPAWCTPRLPQAATSVRHDLPQTTSRSSSRRSALTTPTPSSTSSGTAA
jgi:hypothetical protein